MLPSSVTIDVVNPGANCYCISIGGICVLYSCNEVSMMVYEAKLHGYLLKVVT